MNTALIRPVAPEDRPGWDALYQAYAEFYRVIQTPDMRDRVWGWLHDPGHEVQGLVAEAEGGLIGLAHFRAFARPLSAATGGYLDDLFVSPGARGTGAGEALIEGVKAVARLRGWTLIRWITAEDNYRARSRYDRLATRTQWVTYDLRLVP
jgi:GNAT superfamily N-acetyltransferase